VNRTWREARVELVDGYGVIGPDGQPSTVIDAARVAIEGGFLHIEVPGVDATQTVSAPAVKRLMCTRAGPSPMPPA
jgi:hypothetical protein